MFPWKKPQDQNGLQYTVTLGWCPDCHYSLLIHEHQEEHLGLVSLQTERFQVWMRPDFLLPGSHPWEGNVKQPSLYCWHLNHIHNRVIHSRFSAAREEGEKPCIPRGTGNIPSIVIMLLFSAYQNHSINHHITGDTQTPPHWPVR